MSKHIPNPIIVNSNPDHECASTVIEEDFTLRDLFAAAALSGLWANDTLVMDSEDAAESAYLSADAMLAERAKK